MVSADKGGDFGTLFTGPSNALECFTHELLIAKLHTCGFDMK